MTGALLWLLPLAAVAGLVLLVVVNRLLYICQPNEVLIFSGGQRTMATGRRVGYRIIKGGRALRINEARPRERR